ncbi:MAG: hypothetical protein AMXMBFR64_01800 [Myxococcales bacterium]
MTSLPGWFATMMGLLEGRTDAAAVEAVLGPSPSGTTRLQYYRTLVSNDWTGLLDAVYPYTRALMAPAQWDAVCRRFLAEHPPNHWELNRLGARLPEWLASQADATPCLADVAAVEWLELEVTLHPAPDVLPWEAGPVVLNPTVDVRQLRWDVPGWLASGRPHGGLTERPTLCIAWRDPRTLRCRLTEGTAAILFVVQAVHQAVPPLDAARGHGVDPDDVEALARDLGRRGLLVAA